MRRFPQWRWHLDEVFVKINGKLCYLWRAVDHEGEVLETVVTAKRDKAAALKFLKRIMKKYGRPRSVVTDGLWSYVAAMKMKEIGNADRQEVGRRLNNRAENSHQPFRRRERAMQRFRSAKTLHAALHEPERAQEARRAGDDDVVDVGREQALRAYRGAARRRRVARASRHEQDRQRGHGPAGVRGDRGRSGRELDTGSSRPLRGAAFERAADTRRRYDGEAAVRPSGRSGGRLQSQEASAA